MYKITIIGTGYVGLTTGIGLANFGCNVLCADINQEKIEFLKQAKMPFYEPGMEEILVNNIKNKRIDFTSDVEAAISWAELVFIAVGTPQGPDGRADLKAVYACAESIGRNLDSYKIIVTKSTVPIGTNERIRDIIAEFSGGNQEFDVVSNPEFLREGRAVYDFFHPDRIVVGTFTQKPIETIKKIYRPLYLNEVPFIFTDIRTAEIIKYSSNCFLAMKVAYINEISRFCDLVGADVQSVAIAMGKDGRIGSKFLHPGPGFGGSCFPKDLSAFASFGKELGAEMKVIDAVMESNAYQKRFVFDKVKKQFDNLKGVKLAILGVAFKSETDDLRDSPAIDIINLLLEAGAELKVFDPQANGNAKKLWGEAISYAEDEYDAVKGMDGMLILTEWNQFRNLDLVKVSSLMKGNLFFDFRNIYKRSEIESFQLEYIGLGK